MDSLLFSWTSHCFYSCCCCCCFLFAKTMSIIRSFPGIYRYNFYDNYDLPPYRSLLVVYLKTWFNLFLSLSLWLFSVVRKQYTYSGFVPIVRWLLTVTYDAKGSTPIIYIFSSRESMYHTVPYCIYVTIYLSEINFLFCSHPYVHTLSSKRY